MSVMKQMKEERDSGTVMHTGILVAKVLGSKT